MKDDTELDDGILGTALARAIDAQPAHETPFEASRVAIGAARRARPSAWPLLAAAAVVVLALAVGAALGGRRPSENAAATQPVPTAAAATAEASASPVAVPPVPVLVYFARDGLPPVAASVLGHAATGSTDTPGDHISDRIGALWGAQDRDVPTGSRNAFGRPQTTGSGSLGQSVKINGDTATIDLRIDPPPLVRTTADAKAIVQQLVYTATEEPGIRRVTLLSDGKPLVLGSYPVETRPLAREDVSGYASSGPTGAFPFDGASVPSQLTTAYTVDSVAPGLARFTIAVAFTRSVPVQTAPQFTVTAYDHTQMPGAKAELEITIPGGSDTTTAATQVDRTPLRSIAGGKPNGVAAQTYRLGLDDLRPWRAVVLFDPTRIVIDVGGVPSMISADANEAVYAPAPNSEVGHTFTLSGAARAYEATVNFRVRDDRQSVLLYGFAKASIGTSAVWGAYDATVSVPASVSGNVTLEVFEVSPKDGTETSKVTIPLRVR